MATNVRLTGRICMFLLGTLLVCAPARAHQAATPGAETSDAPIFAILPEGEWPNGYFELTLSPGESANLTAVVATGKDSAPATLRTYATVAAHPSNGGFGPGAEDDEQTGAAAWLEYPAQVLELNADSRAMIPFTVSVPATAAPGQYVAALVAEFAGPMAIPGMQTFDHVIRSALAVTIVVPGPATYGFEIGDVQLVARESTTELSLPVHNTGNYLVRPSGEITVARPDGTEVARVPIAMKAVYGGLEANIIIQLPEVIPAGEYLVNVKLEDVESGTGVQLDAATVTLAAPEVEQAVFTIDSATVSPVGDPVQYLDVAVEVTNPDDPIAAATVLLQVYRNNALMESYPLATNRALATGQTVLEGRYIPAEGWASGNYTFAIDVTSGDMTTNAQVVLATAEIEGGIDLP